MRFDLNALHDGSQPLYAPCLVWSRDLAFWKAPAKYRALGYEPSSVRLPGRRGDGLDLDRARKARELTRAMLARFAQPSFPVGTWDWLIARYEGDEFSPIHEVKANTRAGYLETLARWKGAIGHLKIEALTYEVVKRTQAAMIAKGRSDAYIKRMFTMLRIVTGYGVALRLPAAREVASVLSEIRFASAPKRSVTPTRAQIRAIIDEADARGMFAFATGLLIQWTYMLRAVDVRGHWLPAPKSEGGIWRDGQRWQDGLTWEMVGDTFFEKVISKTGRSMPEAMRFDLTPEIASRLRLMGNRGRFGPVIVSERFGEPYTRYSWSQAFRRIRDDLKLPSDIAMMDTRAGAITEAKTLGAAPWELRDAAQHANVSTTDRYSRARSEAAAKVVQLRQNRT